MAGLRRRLFECSRRCRADHYRCQACGRGVCTGSVDIPSLRGLNSNQLIKKLASFHADAYGKEHEYHYVDRKWWK